MESAINVLVSKFKVYAGSEGSSDTLSRDEFYKLVKAELSNFVKVRPRSGRVVGVHVLRGWQVWSPLVIGDPAVQDIEDRPFTVNGCLFSY